MKKNKNIEYIYALKEKKHSAFYFSSLSSLDMTERGLAFLFLLNKFLKDLQVCHFVSGQGKKLQQSILNLWPCQGHWAEESLIVAVPPANWLVALVWAGLPVNDGQRWTTEKLCIISSAIPLETTLDASHLTYDKAPGLQLLSTAIPALWFRFLGSIQAEKVLRFVFFGLHQNTMYLFMVWWGSFSHWNPNKRQTIWL